MRLKIRNDLEEMARLREAVVGFAHEKSLSEDIVFALDLCLEELVTNVIFYGYEDQNQHSIDVSLNLVDGSLILQIIDDGKEFDPTHLPEPNLDIPLEERKIGGLGVHLVRNYVDSMEYKREDGQNILTIKKKV
jgi:anti-sigma regulatory factor (Ser/Thr protein kinase)